MCRLSPYLHFVWIPIIYFPYVDNLMQISMGGQSFCRYATVFAAAIAVVVLMSMLLAGAFSSDAESSSDEKTEIIIDIIGGNEKHLFGSGPCGFFYEASSDNPLFDKDKLKFTKPSSDNVCIGINPMGLTADNFAYDDESVTAVFRITDGTIYCVDAAQHYNTNNIAMQGDTKSITLTVSSLESAHEESRGLKITSSVAQIVFSPEIVDYLYHLDSDITYTVVSGEGKQNVISANLSEESTPVSFILSKDGVPLTDLHGTATVYVPHTVAYKEDPNRVSAVFIDTSGNCTPLSPVCYSEGKVVFCTNHLSEFAVVPTMEPKGYALALVTMIITMAAMLGAGYYLMSLRSKDKRVPVPVDE